MRRSLFSAALVAIVVAGCDSQGGQTKAPEGFYTPPPYEAPPPPEEPPPAQEEPAPAANEAVAAPEPTPEPTPGESEFVDPEKIGELIIYTPDPDRRKLAATSAAKAKKRVSARVNYCIDRTGKTYDIEVAEGTTAPDDLLEVLKKTVEGWRYKPPKALGGGTSVCTYMVFNLNFN